MSPGYTACAVRDRNLPLTKTEISPKTAEQQASRLLRHAKVRGFLRERMEAVEKKFELTVERTLHGADVAAVRILGNARVKAAGSTAKNLTQAGHEILIKPDVQEVTDLVVRRQEIPHAQAR